MSTGPNKDTPADPGGTSGAVTNDLVISELEYQGVKYRVTVRERQILWHKHWLNDKLIEWALVRELTVRSWLRGTNDSPVPSRLLLFHTFDGNWAEERSPRLDNTRRTAQVFDTDYLIWPQQIGGNHWTMVIVAFPWRLIPSLRRRNADRDRHFTSCPPNEGVNEYGSMLKRARVDDKEQARRWASRRPVDLVRLATGSMERVHPTVTPSQLSNNEPIIIWLDSMSNPERARSRANAIGEWLQRAACRQYPAEMKEAFHIYWPPGDTFARDAASTALPMPRLVLPPVPQQDNSYDCGLYAVHFAVCFLRDTEECWKRIEKYFCGPSDVQEQIKDSTYSDWHGRYAAEFRGMMHSDLGSLQNAVTGLDLPRVRLLELRTPQLASQSAGQGSAFRQSHSTTPTGVHKPSTAQTAEDISFCSLAGQPTQHRPSLAQPANDYSIPTVPLRHSNWGSQTINCANGRRHQLLLPRRAAHTTQTVTCATGKRLLKQPALISFPTAHIPPPPSPIVCGPSRRHQLSSRSRDVQISGWNSSSPSHATAAPSAAGGVLQGQEDPARRLVFGKGGKFVHQSYKEVPYLTGAATEDRFVEETLETRGFPDMVVGNLLSRPAVVVRAQERTITVGKDSVYACTLVTVGGPSTEATDDIRFPHNAEHFFPVFGVSLARLEFDLGMATWVQLLYQELGCKFSEVYELCAQYDRKLANLNPQGPQGPQGPQDRAWLSTRTDRPAEFKTSAPASTGPSPSGPAEQPPIRLPSPRRIATIRLNKAVDLSKRMKRMVETCLLAKEPFLVLQDTHPALDDNTLMGLLYEPGDVPLRMVAAGKSRKVEMLKWTWKEVVEEMTGVTKRADWIDIRDFPKDNVLANLGGPALSTFAEATLCPGAVGWRPSRDDSDQQKTLTAINMLGDMGSWHTIRRRDAQEKFYIASKAFDQEKDDTTSLHVDEAGAINIALWAKSEKGKRPTDDKAVAAEWTIYPIESRPYMEQAAQNLLKRRAAPGSWLGGHPLFGQKFTATPAFTEELVKLGGQQCAPVTINQKVGEAVVILPGFPHQVVNRRGCVKMARDFMPPGHIEEMLRVQQERATACQSAEEGRDACMIRPTIYMGWRAVLAAAITEFGDGQPGQNARMAASIPRLVRTMNAAFEDKMQRLEAKFDAALERIADLEKSKKAVPGEQEMIEAMMKGLDLHLARIRGEDGDRDTVMGNA
ncbi:hypothetical protein OC845_002769 [Tilletia horrida]|nr:hypothetical protein OC845_002769 [Tilletia horrida]